MLYLDDEDGNDDNDNDNDDDENDLMSPVNPPKVMKLVAMYFEKISVFFSVYYDSER